ncbi:Transcriptional regulator WhiB4 [Corynebacterium atrinae]|uniref:Transcriptional regulator WhiB n=1 Tax=Corynebacterium testudinoris TaxID=136857 RepID=A0A0G3H2T7_9CORY|nr:MULTISPECIES: WhiB family transcriptional regulator [Corynebacterium]AKK07699.1 Transcription factor WhiB [Corynebacterium testudinoris]MBX8995811.1 WhiB family transcriptional regulator [Corynebacterium testudinoris]WJY62352.1 Transcriptional regulator WhiB4 [Corynebacterium atrinae]
MVGTITGGSPSGDLLQASADQESLCFERGEWITQAKCRSGDPDALFVRGAEQRKAAVICRHCPVVIECRADALDNKVEFGVWGGLTERQRRALLRKNPHIDSWAEFLAAGGEIDGL